MELQHRASISISISFSFFLISFCVLPLCTLATDHIVGANRGWQPPANAGADAHLNYTVWAQSQKFYLDDVISFHYPEGMQYSVFQVNFSVYTNCTISMWSGHDWIYNWTTKSGRTQVLLNRTGWFYFVDANNCNNGMKVAVNVTKNSTSSGLSSDTSKKSENSSSPSSLVTITTIFFAQAFLFLSISFLFPSF